MASTGGGGISTTASNPAVASNTISALPEYKFISEKVLENGVVIRTITEGNNTHFPRKGSNIRAHYEARLKIDGVVTAVFDSSRLRREPLVCRVGAGALVSGLDVALLHLSRGQLSQIEVPPHRAYGARGYPPIVPPDAVILYEFELMAIE